jgi:hypothetical protein
MARDRRRSLVDAELYGFRWRQLDVIRLMERDESRVVSVESDYHKVQVYVSPTGRSVRVWKDGEELK